LSPKLFRIAGSSNGSTFSRAYLGLGLSVIRYAGYACWSRYVTHMLCRCTNTKDEKQASLSLVCRGRPNRSATRSCSVDALAKPWSVTRAFWVADCHFDNDCDNVSHSTCPPLSPSPHANSIIIGTAEKTTTVTVKTVVLGPRQRCLGIAFIFIIRLAAYPYLRRA
jgi:hypothetical protein